VIGKHFDAVRALLAGGILESRVYDQVRINGTTTVRDNYAVLMFESSDLNDERYTVQQELEATARYRFDVRSVATSASGLRMYMDAVRSQLIGAVPAVTDRTCTAIQLVGGVEEGRPMFDATANLHYATESFEFWSRRA
jgi:hypothetical protein